MRNFILLCLVLFVAACAGPVQVAKTETEGLKAGYSQPELTSLSTKYAGLLRSVYARYRLNRMGLSKGGLGFTSLTDNMGQRLYYLMVQIRPEDVNFDGNSTTGEQRLDQMLRRYFERNLKVLTEKDLAHEGIDGVAFGMTWPVRDFSQCDTAGGFVEYMLAYIDKEAFFSILDGSDSVWSVLAASEIVASLDLAQPKSIKLKYK